MSMLENEQAIVAAALVLGISEESLRDCLLKGFENADTVVGRIMEKDDEDFDPVAFAYWSRRRRNLATLLNEPQTARSAQLFG